MRKLLWIVLVLLAGSSAWALDGQFDRSAEIAKLGQAFQTGTRATVINAGRELYVAGISDAGLAAQIGARLSSEVGTIDVRDKIGQQYLEWLGKGLASTGVEATVTVLRDGAKRAKSKYTREFYSAEADKVGWYKRRNEVMASNRWHREGEDPEIARLLNLLKSDDFSFKLHAADRINWSRKFDARTMAEINAQLLEHMDDNTRNLPWDQAKTIEKTLDLYVKLLGYSGNVGYRETLEKVIKTVSSPGMKSHAKESLDRLRN